MNDVERHPAEPRVTVVLPMYRGQSTISDALRSVLDQEYESMQTLIFDDGSPDASGDVARGVLAEYPGRDAQVVSQPNMGLAATLNRGIAMARGTYISRQDQDDLVLPGRIAAQVAYLDAHPDVAMVGTWAHIHVGDTPTDRYHRHPASGDALRLELLFDNPFVHSSVMMRADVVRRVGGYSEDRSRQPPEDYELWSRIARDHPVANIPQVLTVYRETPGSMSRSGPNPFLESVMRISSENLHQVLGEAFPLAACQSLARLYHTGVPTHGLRRALARRMFDEAATRIAGPGGGSAEFRASRRRLRATIDARFAVNRVPRVLRTPLRALRRRLLAWRRT